MEVHEVINSTYFGNDDDDDQFAVWEMHCKQIFSNHCGIFLSEHEVEFQLGKAIKLSR